MIKYNGKKINVTRFPDKTSQVWQLGDFVHPRFGNNRVDWHFEGEHETFPFLQLVHLTKPDEVYIPYMPYARQDKEVDNESSFALSTFLNCLSGVTNHYCKFASIDVHNEKPLNEAFGTTHFKSVYPESLKKVVEGYDLVIFPDKGAKTRYADTFGGPMTAYCEKVRDQQTGYITSYNTFGLDRKIDRLKVMVVDDLCDGGATFNILAESLLNTNGITCPITLDLCVTHGLFSKGVDTLLQNYDQIFTSDSLFHELDLTLAAKQSTIHKEIKNAINEGKMKILPCLIEGEFNES